jgi:hypothetical protein
MEFDLDADDPENFRILVAEIFRSYPDEEEAIRWLINHAREAPGFREWADSLAEKEIRRLISEARKSNANESN